MRLLLLVVAVSLAHAQLGDWEDYQLVWEDQFDTLDLTKWDHEITAWGGGNSEFELYTDDPTNSYVSNGILHLKPTLLVENTNPLTGQPFGDAFLTDGVLDLEEMYGRCTNPENYGCYRLGAQRDIPPIMSARLRTFERFSFTFGRVRIRARMPIGDWLWPAIWMLPEYWLFGDWPRSGEVDIIETKGNEDYFLNDGVTWAGIQNMGTTLHWGPDGSQNRYYLTSQGHMNETNNYGGWHMLEMDWSLDGYRFLVDDFELANFPNPLIPNNPGWTGWWDFGAPYDGWANPGWNTTMSPFDEAFHFIMNVAVGGTNWFFPEDGINRGGQSAYAKPWSNYDYYTDAFNKFYDRKDDWYWTWTKEGDGNHMQVDFVEVYQLINSTMTEIK